MRALVLCFFASLALSAAALGQPTAFAYQGRLKNGAQPAAGLHDFRFRLWDAPSGGTQLGSTQCADNVAVTEGLFTTSIDFGQQFATSTQLFLEIEVRADAGLGCANAAGFVVLAPRQAITPAPVATHAKTAFSLAAADGSPANAVLVDNSGNVGIGTALPAAKLHIAGADEGLRISGTGVGAPNSAWAGFCDSLGTRIGWIGDGSSGDNDIYVASDAGDVNLYTGNSPVLTVKPGQNVGIGTSAPTAKLDVRGDIVLGPSGQYRAAAGEENLRIIRGEVRRDATIRVGSGFTVDHVENATYDINFTTPFSGAPVVTATAYRGDAAGSTAGVIVMIEFVTGTRVRLVVRNVALDEWIDHHFDFIAIGPR